MDVDVVVPECCGTCGMWWPAKWMCREDGKVIGTCRLVAVRGGPMWIVCSEVGGLLVSVVSHGCKGWVRGGVQLAGGGKGADGEEM